MYKKITTTTKLGDYILSQTVGKGIHTKKLAEIVGMNHSYISSYIYGRYLPTVPSLLLLAEGISILDDNRDVFEILFEMIKCFPDADNALSRWQKREDTIRKTYTGYVVGFDQFFEQPQNSSITIKFDEPLRIDEAVLTMGVFRATLEQIEQAVEARHFKYPVVVVADDENYIHSIGRA